MASGLRFLGDELTPGKLAVLAVVAVAVGVPLGVQAGELIVDRTDPGPAKESGNPTIPVPEAPSDGAVAVSRTPTFDWMASQDASPVTYTLHFSQDPTFSGTTKSIAVFGLRDSEHTVSEEHRLPPGSTWYWRVFAIDAWSNPSEWSETWRFTTGALAD